MLILLSGRSPPLSVLRPISGTTNPARKADAIFVHGLGGGAFATWRYGLDEASSWPHWLGADFPDIAVWSLEYAASASSWLRFTRWFSKSSRDAGYAMALPRRAREVLNLMVQQGLGDRPILFVAHSLGGLVVKQVLRRSFDCVDPRDHAIFAGTRAVLFLATPHAGAELASKVSAFRTVFGATVSIDDLRAHDAQLEELYDWYRNHATTAGIWTETFYEQREVSGFIIVNSNSSHPGVGKDPIPLDEDHISIAKPKDRNYQVYGAAKRLLADCVLRIATAPVPLSNGSALQSVPISVPVPAEPPPPALMRIQGPTPHELPPGAEEFFGRQTELDRLIQRLQAAKNTAVVGPAGMGKTALAARALQTVVGETAASLAASPFPDGVVYMDLYALRGFSEAAWESLANKLAGASFLERAPARDRATNACLGKRVLVVIEGAEEADGQEGRTTVPEFLSVLSPQNRWLLLTRLSTQSNPVQTIELKEALHPDDAALLFDSLTGGRVPADVRKSALELLEGHPLALTWAGNLLAREDETPERLIGDWTAEQLPGLSDPRDAEHTLAWLFQRSIRGLDASARRALAAAALLARAPFPLAAIEAALGDPDDARSESARHALRALVQSSLLRRTSEEDQWQFTHVLGYRFARQETGSDPAVRKRLGDWLHGHLSHSLLVDLLVKAAGPASTARALEHLGALLRTDDDQSLWFPLVDFVLYNATDRLTQLGRLGQVRLALDAVLGWIDRLPKDKADEAYWLRERSSWMDRQCDLMREQGDLNGALEACQNSLSLMRRVAESDATNVGWQRDLSVSCNKVGDVQRERGQLPEALAAYQESLEVRQRLADANPTDPVRQRDIGVSQERIGGVLWDQKQYAGAANAFQISLGIRQQLVDASPGDYGLRRDLGVIHGKVGDVLRDQNELDQAAAAYERSLEVSRGLAELDASNTVWQRDLSFNLTRLAQVHEKNNKPELALPLAVQSYEIDTRLTALDPTNATWQRDKQISGALVQRLQAAQGVHSS